MLETVLCWNVKYKFSSEFFIYLGQFCHSSHRPLFFLTEIIFWDISNIAQYVWNAKHVFGNSAFTKPTSQWEPIMWHLPSFLLFCTMIHFTFSLQHFGWRFSKQTWHDIQPLMSCLVVSLSHAHISTPETLSQIISNCLSNYIHLYGSHPQLV